VTPLQRPREPTQEKRLTLKEWLQQSRFQGGVKQFAEALGVPFKTAEDWVYRGRNPSSANKRKILALTGLDEYAPLAPEQVLGPTRAAEALERVYRIKELVLALDRELTFFKNNSPQHREVLKKNMDGPYIAYVTNLFQLMFNEKRFQDWLKTTRLFK